MKSIKKSYLFVLLFLFLFLAIIFLYIPSKQALVFVEPDRDKILCFVPISAGETFKIKYKHSIHLTDVIESYQITEQKEIRQYELEYEDFAIGMPSEVAEGETFEMKDGKYYIKNMNRRFEQFILRVGKVRANHTFVQGHISFPLTKAIEPGTRVRIQVKKINILQQMEGVNILEHNK
ncbi:DUF1850 domain-containing protein [Mesobacillus jeotgali]|uniref:DUF1850 domain-containing protein n=1 Tax=Mesobacillus jeotgali TaxID=129985 RepID=UPI0009A6CE70|nr:DUF1850 domain-containing protein [Mesobacillus jeotgali]